MFGDMRIKIDGDILVVDDVFNGGYLPTIKAGGEEYFLASDRDHAESMARQHWQEMAENDPGEFTAMVGQDTLVAWALGQYAGPGYEKVRSLAEWLDLVAEHCEEEWGEELEVQRVGRLLEELEFTPTLAYKSM